MNKKLKRKIIISVITIILGLIILFSIFIFKNIFTEDKIDYATGFSSGLISVGIIMFIKVIFATFGIDKGKAIINSLQDERLIAINNEASEITLKITTLISAIVSIALFFFGLKKEGIIVSVLVGISTLIYLMSYFRLNRKK